jgi:hypothetical protein
VDPETFRRLPIWYPEYHRGAPIYDAKYERQYTNKKRGGEDVSLKTEPNIQAGKAIRQAMGIPVSWRGYNWTVCHIWGIDDPTFQQSNVIVRDPCYYSCVGNMVLLPTPLKALTDSVPELKHMLRVCAYNIYGWVPVAPDAPDLADRVELVRGGAVFADYPQSWPRTPGEKLPPGIMPYNAAVEANDSETQAGNQTTAGKRGLSVVSERVGEKGAGILADRAIERGSCGAGRHLIHFLRYENGSARCGFRKLGYIWGKSQVPI